MGKSSHRIGATAADRGSEPGRETVRGWRVAYLTIATVGICLSADLMRLHVNVHTDPDYQSYCAMSESVNCAQQWVLATGMEIILSAFATKP